MNKSRILILVIHLGSSNIGIQSFILFGTYYVQYSGKYGSKIGRRNNELITTLDTVVQLTPKEKEVVDNINDLILNHPLNDYHQADFLEAISTAYYFKNYNEALLDDDLFEKTKAEKPYISDKIIVIAINTVKKMLFKPEYLTEDIKKELDLWNNADD